MIKANKIQIDEWLHLLIQSWLSSPPITPYRRIVGRPRLVRLTENLETGVIGYTFAAPVEEEDCFPDNNHRRRAIGKFWLAVRGSKLIHRGYTTLVDVDEQNEQDSNG